MRSKAEQAEIVKRALSVPNRETPANECNECALPANGKRQCEASELAPLDITEGRIIAVEICSNVLEAHIWLAFDDSFSPGDGQAVFYADELPFLATKDAETLREIHKMKLAFPGSRVRQ